jgi:hypothetical protein
MGALLLIPVLMSALLAAAHFLRAGNLMLVIASCAAPLLLLARRTWATRLLQLLLVLGAMEWLRTLYMIIQERRETDRPWTASAIILGSVAAWTAASALVFAIPFMRRHYCRGAERPEHLNPASEDARV